MPDLGCGISGSPDLTATPDPALVSAQGGASAAFHEGCETFNLGHHQRGSERGAGRIILMVKNLIRRFAVLSPRGKGQMAALLSQKRANPACGIGKAGRGVASDALEGE